MALKDVAALVAVIGVAFMGIVVGMFLYLSWPT